MYGIYGNIYHQYTPNVSIYTIHGSYGFGLGLAATASGITASPWSPWCHIAWPSWPSPWHPQPQRHQHSGEHQAQTCGPRGNEGAAMAATQPFAPHRVAVAMTTRASTTTWNVDQEVRLKGVCLRLNLMPTAVILALAPTVLLQVEHAMHLRARTTIWSVLVPDPTLWRWQTMPAQRPSSLRPSTIFPHTRSARRNASSSPGADSFSSRMALWIAVWEALEPSARYWALAMTWSMLRVGITTMAELCRFAVRQCSSVVLRLATSCLAFLTFLLF